MRKYIAILFILPTILSAENVFSDTYDLWTNALTEQRTCKTRNEYWWYCQGQRDAYEIVLERLSTSLPLNGEDGQCCSHQTSP